MRVNVFIRKDNEGKWNAIANKSEWINTLLANSDDTSSYGKTRSIAKEKYVTVLSEELPPTRGFSKVPVKREEAFVPRPPDPETGYPCCTQKRPCKHWQWDVNRALYTNVLTGKEREPDIV